MFFQSAGVFAVVEVVLILLALVVVPRDRRPSSALADLADHLVPGHRRIVLPRHRQPKAASAAARHATQHG